MTLVPTEPKKIYMWNKEIKAVYLWTTKVRPAYKPRTFTISRTEQSNMSSWWTYSDDAAWLTAGDGAFDDFFWYSAVLLNTSGVETAEMKQSWWVFTWAMTTLGNITSGDNVMIKFPVRWIKMTKSWSTVTLSITEEQNKDWYQYYAHSTGALSNPWTPKKAFYLGAYKWYNSSNVIKSWSGQSPTWSVSQANFCTYAKNNWTWYNIEWFYQRMYINALYMMKYWNAKSQNVVGKWASSTAARTWWTNSQTNATYWTTSTSQQMKLFWLEDRWGNYAEWIWGCYTNNSKQLYVMLSWWSWASSWWEWTWITISNWSYQCLSSISWENKAMFAPLSTVNNYSYNTYYCDGVEVYAGRLAYWWWFGWEWEACGAFRISFSYAAGETYAYFGTRLMYL